jgi:hypothetical protein
MKTTGQQGILSRVPLSYMGVQPQTVVDNSSPFLLLVWLPFSI